MIHKTFRITCDANGCTNHWTLVGRAAALNSLKTGARIDGWSVSEDGHFCPDHRKAS